MGHIFVSYRSPIYEDLVRNKCKILQGGECTPEISKSCSFKDCSYRKACIWRSQYPDYDIVIVPPTYILNPKDLLTVFDFIRYCPELYKAIRSANQFVRFGIENDSFWTEIELYFWKMHCFKWKINPEALTVKSEIDGTYSMTKSTFTPFTKNDYDLYWRMVYYIQDEHKFDTIWGKYANCFVQKCPNCGNNLLLSPKAVNYLIANNIKYTCPFCREGHFSYKYNGGKHLVACNYNGPESDYKKMSPDFIVSLLLDSHRKSPKNSTPLICMSRETFRDKIAILVYVELVDLLVKKVIGYGDLEMRVFDPRQKKTIKYTFKKGS